MTTTISTSYRVSQHEYKWTQTTTSIKGNVENTTGHTVWISTLYELACRAVCQNVAFSKRVNSKMAYRTTYVNNPSIYRTLTHDSNYKPKLSTECRNPTLQVMLPFEHTIETFFVINYIFASTVGPRISSLSILLSGTNQ